MPFNRIVIIIIILCSKTIFGQQITNQQVLAKINTEEVNDVINIKSTATNKEGDIKSLRYVLYIIKTNLQTSQSNREEKTNRFILNAYQSKDLEVTSINKNIKDKITALLLIYNEDNKLIGKDRLVVINDNEAKKEVKKVIGSQQVNDGISITGIVTDNTKTKSGRDFYREFFSVYTLRQINAKQIINIEEKLSLGRNTNIVISADGKVIHQFPARRNTDFIKQMTQVTIEQLNRHIQSIERQKQ